MNKVVLMGNLTRDPEIRYSQGAEPVAVARYGIAVSRRFSKDKENDTDFFNCVVFGKGAEFAEKYFKKGMKVVISGRLQQNNWEDNSGQKRSTVEIIVEDQEFAESKASFEARRQGVGSSGAASYTAAQPKADAAEGFSEIPDAIDDEDLPF